MGMLVMCSKGCGFATQSDSHRGSRLGDCPDCGGPLQGWTAGRTKGRYQCPVSGHVATLGLGSALQLDQPMRLAFQPRTDWSGQKQITEPSGLHDFEQRWLERMDGKVLGPGCVVGWSYSPPGPTRYNPDQVQAGIALVPAPESDPASWFVNEPVTYKKCAACPARVVASDENCMDRQWAPARSWYWAGRNNRTRHPRDTNPGPHPAGTYACYGCRHGEKEPW